ncbi:MAG: hypothetical protein HZC37_15450 [Burkholderiales bacterium]|nr:hypothetical protein [Burkholderiales bacterium]
MQNDPLWKLRHALAGVLLAVVVSVPIAAFVGSALGEALGGTYAWRAGVYGALLLYVVVGAGVLFAKVARHETRPMSVQRVGLWLASLWLWPLMWLLAAKRPVMSAPQPASPASAPRPPSTPSPPAPPVPPPPPAAPSL